MISPQLQEAIASSPAPKFIPDLSEDDAIIQARQIKALSDPTRLQILSLLRKHGGLLTVQEIVSCFRLEQPSISHHLRILREAGLIDNHKRSLYVYYYLKPATLNAIGSFLQSLVGLDQ